MYYKMIGVLSNLPLPEDVIDIIYEYKWGDPKKNKKNLMNSVIHEQPLYNEVFWRLSSQYRASREYTAQFSRDGQGVCEKLSEKFLYSDLKYESLHQKIINIIVVPRIYTHPHLFCFSDDLKILNKKKYNNYMDGLKNNICSCTWHSRSSSMTKNEMKLICRSLTKLFMSGKYEIKRETKYSF